MTPGLGTVLVGDDPGSQLLRRRASTATAPRWASPRIRVDLPATRPRPRSRPRSRELNADPSCTGYIVQLPLPAGLDAQPRPRARWTRPRTPTACTRSAWAGWSSAPRRRCRAPRAGIVELLRRYDVPLAGADVVRRRPRRHRRPAAGPAADPPQRERDGDPVPHRHPGPRPPTPARADIVVAAVGVAGLITADMVKPGAAVLDVGVSRTDAGLVGDVDPGRPRGRGLPRADAGRGRADDPRDAPHQRGRGRRAVRRGVVTDGLPWRSSGGSGRSRWCCSGVVVGLCVARGRALPPQGRSCWRHRWSSPPGCGRCLPTDRVGLLARAWQAGRRR